MFNLGQLESLLKNLERDGARLETYGKSESGRPLFAVTVGTGIPKTLIFGAIHAREHITAKLVLNLAALHKGDAVTFVPCANPDGVTLAVDGLGSAPPDRRATLLKYNGNSNDFSLWKANIRGVDLNVNFNADWGTGKQNIFVPAPQNYVGPFPESEKETQALIDLVAKYAFKVAIAYHAKGRVIYYGFNDNIQHEPEAQLFAQSTGYELLTSQGSAGGFKDWFVQRGGFGLTIEVGRDALTYTQLYGDYATILQENLQVPVLAAEVAKWI